MSFGDINRVNTNLQSLNSQFSLNKINSRMADNQLKLSTGLRINKAEDDAAGFSIASKLSGRIAGLEQAERNVGDAKSMLDVAETGMNSIMDTLVDMKSKATQAATDSIGQDERNYIGDQIVALADEINAIAGQTTFQGTSLLGETDDAGTVTGNTVLNFQVGEGSTDNEAITIAETNISTLFEGASHADSDGNTIATDGDANSSFGSLTIAEDTGSAAYSSFIDSIDTAIGNLSSSFNQIGIDQNSLSIKQENLAQSISSNSAARSRIEDADFAKVQSESVKLQIMQQTATSALAQANSSPQAVLGFLGG